MRGYCRNGSFLLRNPPKLFRLLFRIKFRLAQDVEAMLGEDVSRRDTAEASPPNCALCNPRLAQSYRALLALAREAAQALGRGEDSAAAAAARHRPPPPRPLTASSPSPPPPPTHTTRSNERTPLGGRLSQTDNLRCTAMLREAGDFAVQMRKCEKAIRALATTTADSVRAPARLLPPPACPALPAARSARCKTLTASLHASTCFPAPADTTPHPPSTHLPPPPLSACRRALSAA